MTPQAPIRILLLNDVRNAADEPRAGLLLPPHPAAIDRRPLLQMFATVTAALEMKRQMEGERQ